MIRSALLLLALAACAPTPASGVVAPAAPTIQVADTGYVNVTGTGTVAVEPDLARISFAVESESADARSAVRDNADLMTAVMAALRGAYSDVEIETHGYSLQPRYTRPDRDGQREVSGYTVLNHVRVTVDEIDRVGALIDAATGAGANRVASLSFGSGDLEDAREEALRRAVVDAREQAATIADAPGGLDLVLIDEMASRSGHRWKCIRTTPRPPCSRTSAQWPPWSPPRHRSNPGTRRCV